MDKIICPFCSKTEFVWIPLYRFIVSWLEGRPTAIMAYYKCQICDTMLSISYPVVQEGGDSAQTLLRR